MKKILKLIAILLLITSTYTPLVSAKTKESIDAIINQIAIASGVPEYVVINSIDTIATRENLPKLDIAIDLRNEVFEARPNKNRLQPMPSSLKVGSETLPYSVPGDIWYSFAFTSFYNHGHVAMYSTSLTIVEARGYSYTVAERNIPSIQANPGDVVMAVKQTLSSNSRVSLSIADEAIAWARSKKGRAYALTLDNKTCGNHDYNCSQLVWCAYYNVTGNRDLDSNGGFLVTPDNILYSSWTYDVWSY